METVQNPKSDMSGDDNPITGNRGMPGSGVPGSGAPIMGGRWFEWCIWLILSIVQYVRRIPLYYIDHHSREQ